MKKIYRMALAASALLAMVLAGCANENGGYGSRETEGKSTSMLLKLTFPKQADSRATGDSNATANEAAIHSIDVFIFTEAGLYLSKKRLTPADFTQGSGDSTADSYVSAQIRTTTGKKNIMVGVNLSQALSDALAFIPLTDYKTTARRFGAFDVAANGLPMFSTAEVIFDLQEDETQNIVEVTVQRIAAKITVDRTANMVVAGVAGDLSEISFAVNNMNNKLFLLQGEAPAHKDPNWAKGSYDASEFTQAVAADYKPISNLGDTPGVDDYNPAYAYENTSDGKTKQEITRVTVRAKFLPEEYLKKDGANFVTATSATDGYTSPQTFYAVETTSGSAYLFDAAQADEYATLNSTTKIEYTDGLCYWDMFLNKPSIQNKWDVLRNDYYKCTITRMVAPGKPFPEIRPGEENDTPSEDTSLTVDMKVLFWNPVSANYVLEP